MDDNEKIVMLKRMLDEYLDLELAILVGSRAENLAHAQSDWDIAVQWCKNLPMMENLAATETLRRYLARTLDVEESKIDLIHIPNARLAMRALIAEKGIPLKGEDSLNWNHFLSRTWRELEDYEWEKKCKCWHE